MTTGVRPVDQPTDAIKALRNAIDGLDDFELAALAQVTQASGSLVIGLAVVLGRIGAEEASDAGHLDERWQTEKWGEDDADRKRRRRTTAEIAAAARLLDLIRADDPG